MAGASRGAIEAGRGMVVLGIDMTALDRGLKLAAKKLKDFGVDIQAVGKSLAKAGAVIGAGTMYGVRQFANYEQALADLRAAAGVSESGLEPIRAKIEEVAAATGTMPVEVAGAFSELIKAGIKVDDVIGGLGETTIKFARVSGMAAAETAVVLADAMNVFRRDGISAADAANIMNQAADASTISLRQVSESFAAGGTPAAQFGQNMRDTATAIAIMGKAGLKGAEAGTAIKTFMTRLATGGDEDGRDEAAVAMRELNLQVRDASGAMLPLAQIIDNINAALAGRGQQERDTLLKKLAGMRGILGLLPLLNAGARGWADMRAEMDKALPVGEKFNIMTGTLWGTFQKLSVQAFLIASSIGEALAPTMRWLAGLIMPVLVATRNWVRANPALIRMFDTLGTALSVGGVALIAFGAIVTGMGYLLGFAAVGIMPLLFALKGLLIVGAVVGLVAMLGGSFANVASNARFAGAVIAQAFQPGDVFGAWAQVFSSLSDTFATMWRTVVAAFNAGDLGSAFQAVWLGIRLIWAQGINWIRGAWLDVTHFIVTTFDAVAVEVARGMSRVVGNIADAINAITDRLPDFVTENLGLGRVEYDHDAVSAELDDAARIRNLRRGQAMAENRQQGLGRENGIRGEIAALDQSMEMAAWFAAQVAEVNRQMAGVTARGAPPVAPPGTNAATGREASSIGSFSSAQAAFFNGATDPMTAMERTTREQLRVLGDIRDRLNRAQPIVAR